MKYYVQFYEKMDYKFNLKTMVWEDCKPYLKQCLGSEGVYILDGRNNLNTMIFDADERLKFLDSVHLASGYKIVKGNRFDDNNPVIYKKGEF